MAESLQQKCLNCKKMGIVRCDGCDDRFCSPHLTEHRHHLDTLFERVCNDRDILCEQIKNPRPTSSSDQPELITLLNEIDEWESKILKMVSQLADCARQKVHELMNSNNKDIEVELEKLSEELRRRKEDDNYFEQDIERLTKQLEQIQIDLNDHVHHIRINKTPIDWSTIIQVFTERPKRNIIQQIQTQFSDDRTLLITDHQVQLNKFYGNENQKWELIYKATTNGFDPKICHECCDKQGPTLILVQSSEGYLFGGYTAASWDIGKKKYMVDKTAFLFTLTNPHNIPPTKYMIDSEGEGAISPDFEAGPTFGCWDICIHLQKERNGESYSEFPRDYVDSTGKGELTFTGSNKFSISDIEMYRLASV